MHIRCPHCHDLLDVVSEALTSEIHCTTCGSQFDLIRGDTTESYSQNGSRRIAHFELIERVGMGQSGVVWKALDTTLGRTVALKIPRRDQLTAAEREYFLRDARAAAQLRHPNIVSVHEVGRDQDTVFIAGDFIDGADLKDWLTGHRLTPSEAARLMLKIGAAVQHAHERGVVHRDLKPGNILLDLTGEPHVADFGLAKRNSGEITMTVDGQILGTPAYMSPEQARGESHLADARSDVYSLGVILFELLTGELPFRGAKKMLLVQIQMDDPPSPRKLNSQIPPDLETICLKCLEKDSGRRYVSAQHFCDDLQRHLDGMPILARPISRVERAVRWARRNPRLAAVGSLAVFLLFAVLGVVTAAYFREKKLHDEADQLAEEKSTLASKNLELAKTESAAKAKIEAQSRQLQAQLATSMVARAGEQYALGNVPEAAALLAKAYALTADDDSLRSGIRNLLSAWSDECPLLLRQNQPVWSVAYGEGDLLLSSGSYSIHSWDGSSAQLSSTSARFPESGVSHTAINSDGKLLLLALDDNTVRLWDTVAGKAVGPPRKHGGEVPSMAFSRDGSRIVTSSLDGTVRLWNSSTGEPVGGSIKQAAPAFCTTLSADGAQVLTGCQGWIRRWDAKSGRRIDKGMQHDSTITALAAAPDGKHVITGTSDRLARLWHLESGKEIGEPLKHGKPVAMVRISSDGALALTIGGYDARIWDLETGRSVGGPLKHRNQVLAAQFSADGATLLTGSRDRTVRLWELSRHEPLERIMDCNGSVRAMAISADGTKYLIGCADGQVLQWDAQARLAGPPLMLDGQAISVEFSPDEKTIVTASRTGGVQQWEARSGRPIGPLLKHATQVLTATYRRDGTAILTGCLDGKARLWDARSGEELAEPDVNRHGKITLAAFSPDGKSIVAGCGNRQVLLWDHDSGKLKGRPRRHEGVVRCVAFSRDGRMFATGGNDRVARIWSTATGEPIGEPLAHDQPVVMVAFSPDGATLATAALEPHARLWDVATGKLMRSLEADSDVNSVAFVKEGTLLTGCRDKVLEWQLYPQIPDAPVVVEAWSIVRTGLVVDDSGSLRGVSGIEWSTARQRLADAQSDYLPSRKLYLQERRQRLAKKIAWKAKFYRWLPAHKDKLPPTLSAMPDEFELIAEHQLKHLNFPSVAHFRQTEQRLPLEQFAVVAESEREFAAGQYRIDVLSDDGVRVFINDRLVIDRWKLRPVTLDNATFNLAKGRHTIRVEYFQGTAAAELKFVMLTTKPNDEARDMIPPIESPIPRRDEEPANPEL